MLAYGVGYGTDISLASDLTRDLALTTSGGQTLAEAIVRRLSGTLWHDPTYGYDLIEVIGTGFVGGVSETILQRIAVEVSKDERVSSCDVTDLTQSPEDVALRLEVTPERGPAFSLTLDVDQVEGEISASEPVPVRLPLGNIY